MVPGWRREGNHYDVVFAEAAMESTDRSSYKGKSFGGCRGHPRADFEGVACTRALIGSTKRCPDNAHTCTLH